MKYKTMKFIYNLLVEFRDQMEEQADERRKELNDMKLAEEDIEAIQEVRESWEYDLEVLRECEEAIRAIREYEW